MGFIRALCEQNGVEFNDFCEKNGLNPTLVSDMDVGLINYKTGVYYHKIKEFFNLDSLLFIKFIYERDNKINNWRETLTDELDSTDELRNAHIKKCMEGDDFYQWVKSMEDKDAVLHNASG